MAGAVFLLGQRQTGHGARHPDSERRFARLLRIGVALRVEKALGVNRRRRGLAIVDRSVLAVGEVNHHEAAAADIAGARIARGKGKTDRDCGIHRIAALLQNIDADTRRARLLRHHHAVAGGNAFGTRGSGIWTAILGARGNSEREHADEREARQTARQTNARVHHRSD